MLRGVRGDGVDDLAALETSAFFSAARARGDLIDTARIDPTEVPGDWDAAVAHPRLPVITYPYEWSFSMLQDAALLQLTLAREALADGLLCKDASAYNVQFEGASPVFIDVGSFEVLRAGEPWRAYRQFCQLFLNPLLIQARRDIAFQPLLRGALDGITPTDAARLLGFRHRWRPGALSHVAVHARAERRLASSERDMAGELRRAGAGPALIDAQMKNLGKAVRKLRWAASDSAWSSYSERAHYDDADLGAKEQFVREVVGAVPRRVVWDLGANDGRFSRIAAGAAATVLAVDGDALVIDRLYRELRETGDRRIVPMVMDLIDASPGLGWRGRERAPFWDRTRPDVVLALALVHHLAIPGTVPPDEIVDWLASLDAEVVVEIPHRDDPMVTRLLSAKRAGVFDHYDEAAFDTLLHGRLRVVRQEALPSGRRTLYHLAPRR